MPVHLILAYVLGTLGAFATIWLADDIQYSLAGPETEPLKLKRVVVALLLGWALMPLLFVMNLVYAIWNGVKNHW